MGYNYGDAATMRGGLGVWEYLGGGFETDGIKTKKGLVCGQINNKRKTPALYNPVISLGLLNEESRESKLLTSQWD